MNNIGAFLIRLGAARVAAMALVGVMLAGFFIFLMMRVSTPPMAPLFSELTFEDSTEIVSELNTLNVDYKLRGEGTVIMVPRDQITTIRMSLAESGLPAGGSVGYEIFDKSSTLGATSFVQNINHIRALEGELARTIASISRVKAARVHLVLPERELFRRDSSEATASIVLKVRGQLASDEIRAIQHLVGSAIQGMEPQNVTIIDNSGRLLAAGGDSSSEQATTNSLAESTLALENRMRSRIEKILESIVGPGHVRVQVTAELDHQRTTTTSENYDPDGQVVRSAQNRTITNSSQGSSNSGAVSVSNELPGTDGGGAGGDGASEDSETTDETINYEISKTVQTEINEAGSVKSISIAVAVDGSYLAGDDGVSAYQARTAEEMAQIEDLVRSTIGFDAKRGDQIQIVNLQFIGGPQVEFADSEGGMFSFSRDDIFAVAEMAITLLVSLILIIFVLRPLLARALKPEDQVLTLTDQEVQPGQVMGENGQLISKEEADAIALAERNKLSDQMVGAMEMGESQAAAIRQVGELVEGNPDQAAMIVRNWLRNAA